MRDHRKIWLAGAGAFALGFGACAVSAAVTDFRLPPGASNTPEVEGPVVDDAPPPRPATASSTPASTADNTITLPELADPTATPSPTPSASRTPTPSPSPTPAASRVSPTPSPTPSTTPSSAASSTQTPDAIATESAESAPDPGASPQVDLGLDEEPATPAPILEEEPNEPGSLPSWLPFVLVLLGFGIAWAIGWFWWRRRDEPESEPAAPIIQRPRLKPKDEPTGPASETAPAAPTPAPSSSETTPATGGIRIALEPRQLSVTLVQTTLSYRLILSNSGATALDELVIEGDLVSAHSSLDREQQVATADNPLGLLHTIVKLKPGENVALDGKICLPLPNIIPHRRGELVLFVPLVRLRVSTRGEGTAGPLLLQTSLIGQPSPQNGGKLVPFRLDLGPRIYSELLQRSFA